jgi:hypothetical protein
MAHQSVFSYSDVIRFTAKALTLTQAVNAATSSAHSQITGGSEHVKQNINLVAKVYTALSKNLNHLLKKYINEGSSSLPEPEIK